MALTFSDLIQTSEERVVFTGEQVSDFTEILKQAPMAQREREVVLASLKDAIQVVGYRYRAVVGRHPGTLIGVFAGREWYAEQKAKPRIDWGGNEHGLSIQQMQFARMILHAVYEMTGTPADAHFEQTLVDALHAYDTARTERLKFLEAEYRKMIDRTPSAVLWPQRPGIGEEMADAGALGKMSPSIPCRPADPLADEALLAKTDATDDWRRKEPKP